MEEPDFSKSKIIQVRESFNRLENELGREPFFEEIAIDTNLEVAEVRILLNFSIEEEITPRDEFQLKFKMTIKNNELEKARLGANLLQSELAKKIGIGKASYCQIECCRVYPSIDIQNKIGKVLGKTVESLFPEWLQMFTEKWGNAEKTRIVPINRLLLSDKNVLQLEGGGRSDMEYAGEMAIVKNILGEAIKDLSNRERAVLEQRFFKNLTLEDVAKLNGVTRERVRQIESKALEKLRCNKSVSHLNGHLQNK